MAVADIANDRQREPADEGAAPIGEPERVGETRQGRRRCDELGRAKSEYGPAQRQQPRELEFEADQEQQQDTPSSDTVTIVSGARINAKP
jgi:hypothetical protein